ncbi:polyprotein [Paris potyvirus 3]|nr:polyprotein [Paris potyvirus 3]
MATTMITFGNFTTTLMVGADGNIQAQAVLQCKQQEQPVATPAARQLAAPEPKKDLNLRSKFYNAFSEKVLAARAEAETSAFAALDAACAKRTESMKEGRVVRLRRGYTFKEFTDSYLAARNAQRARVAEEKAWFLNHAPFAVESFYVRDDVEETPELRKPKWQQSKQTKRVRSYKPVTFDTTELLAALVSIARKKPGMTIEVIGKRRNVRCATSTVHNVRCFKAHLKHNEGKFVKQDLPLDRTEAVLQRTLLKACATKFQHQTPHFSYGTSGTIMRDVFDDFGTAHVFVVRGRMNGQLVNALKRQSSAFVKEMEHYSDTATKFWDGFNRSFLNNRVMPVDHQCASDFSVVQCGEVAALVSTIIAPCGRITCKKCAENLMNAGRIEYAEMVSRANAINGSHLRDNFPDFKHINHVLELISKSLSLHNANYEAFAQIQQLIGHKKEAPFTHVQRLNEGLMKLGGSSSDQVNSLSSELLQLARFLKNRSDMKETNSISGFRNKLAGKIHVNTALMCDNQLDTNGNFVWGKRGHHAKRFFSNFYEVIEPSKGYEQYQERRNPNGSRHLAIGNLIVSANFDRVREQLEGTRVHDEPITSSCTSIIDNNFVYTCSCSTHDDGRPLASYVISPTKNHLVIGNSGDPKYVDLPKEEHQRLYIAKEGFCYLNIFLAMLVNVQEEEAKDFTKYTRDVLIPKLGKWPSLQDLATACYMLSVFFPDTRVSELPRILVDHKTKTMHVVDSFGSLSTGYHILRATTVAQLIQFSFNQMTSEMKNYIVGGRPDTDWEEKMLPFFESKREHARAMERLRSVGCGFASEDKWVKTLVKGIFRAHVMKDILEHEPYALVLGMISPGILLALYNSGSLEVAMHHWIRKDQSVAMVVSILSQLARKVSVSSLLVEQKQIIEAHAEALYDAAMQGFKTYESYSVALGFLEVRKNQKEADYALGNWLVASKNPKNLMLLEKNYLKELEDSWQELTWREKFSSTMHWRKQRRLIVEPLTPKKDADSSGRYDVSPRALWGVVANRLHILCASAYERGRTVCSNFVNKFINTSINLAYYLFPDILKTINLLLIFNLLAGLTWKFYEVLREYRILRKRALREAYDLAVRKFEIVHNSLCFEGKEEPTRDEFREAVLRVHPNLKKELLEYMQEDEVEHHAKSRNEIHLEQVMAFITLLTMVFSAEKSDCIYKVLNKLRSLIGTVEQDVYHQGIDEIKDIEDLKNLTVDFELDTADKCPTSSFDCTFSDWWSAQIDGGRVVPHYRIGGHFVEFTRKNAPIICGDIHTSSEKEFLVRGAVGSGKSTGLPFYLAKKGYVLMVEPTRPLAENVSKQLRCDPFNVGVTTRMRGMVTCGSYPIDVMTSGYAMHYLANNRALIRTYNYVIFDECHVLDAQAMALYSLLKDSEFAGKILKVSATPPGRESGFDTQYPVQIETEEQLSFQDFVNAQGNGSHRDVVSRGDNILVYVSSYNEVDQLSKLLIEKHYIVTKVDGRTMKVGQVEITTKGTEERKHFVVATNIIENGVTLDIDVVVDFGMKVVAELDVDNRMMVYTKKSISFGERIQRLGRVGRNKKGYALRVNHTEKGLQEIPVSVATEAAFLCFAYGLPVMTHNVSTNLLNKCTAQQARTMMQFELPIFFMVALVNPMGTMHPQIHKLLKAYKLRECETLLDTRSIPNKQVHSWLTANEYFRLGVRTSLDPKARIPFYSKDIPEKCLQQVWDTIVAHKEDAGFGRLTSTNACKIAYTLQTDALAIQRTIRIIEALIVEEKVKKSHLQTLSAQSCSKSNFTLVSITNALRSRYIVDHTSNNIAILESAKAQLMEFSTLSQSRNFEELVSSYGILDLVQHQSMEAVSKGLRLRGKWNKSLVTNDIVIGLSVLIGGAWMILKHFYEARNDGVYHQGFGKRQRQKLKFRNAKDSKVGREVYADDGTIEHLFGSAYTKKGKRKGNHVGMGKKTRKFINMYGFDPTEYNLVRFVDPLTGATLDEGTSLDISIVQEHFGDIRRKLIDDEELEKDLVNARPGIEAYYIKGLTSKALKVDLTPHNPLKVCKSTIAGFPEREFELRQTGKAKEVDATEVPAPNEEVGHESKSQFQGVRDYNNISAMICKLSNESDGHCTTLYGIGYGGVIITNRHFLKRNNGVLTINSHHGEFVIKNSAAVKVLPIPRVDIVLLLLPKDFPPFPRRLRFRSPMGGDRVVLVSSNFQAKRISSAVSESSPVQRANECDFWQHWISTSVGQCGLPLVDVKQGNLVGLHSLSTLSNSKNFMTAFGDDFQERWLDAHNEGEWKTRWTYNPDEVCWGSMKLHSSQPPEPFKIAKLIMDLGEEGVYQQAEEKWMYNALEGNLKAIGRCDSQLVTKHTVKGPCMLFRTYLNEHEEERKFFEPFMGEYMKSRLNREAFTKDIKKYSSAIPIGDIDYEVFVKAKSDVYWILDSLDFGECAYITDAQEIFAALNMKAAVGALYKGKKKEYFEGYTTAQQDEIVMESCRRLYSGKMGVWNGSLKAELRAKEKVLANKTRTFTAAPIDTLLAGKVCVDDFNNRFYDLHLQGPWTVGMTKFYGGWNEFLNKLPDGWIYFDADGSQFDSSLTPCLIDAVLSLRLSFMEEWDVGEQMLRNLYTEIIYTPIATPDGTIIKKFKGNNSGQPSTVVDNSLMVILAVQYALNKEGVPFLEQEEIFRFFVNGDDLIIAVHPTAESMMENFQSHFAELGLNYTFEARHTRKEDLWFMSHKGVKVEGVFIPKLEEERIVAILEWDRAEQPQHRLEAICAAMVESWGYEELTYRIRKFYQWVLEQAPYNNLAKEGQAPYIAESALKNLYTNQAVSDFVLEQYAQEIFQDDLDEDLWVLHQADDEARDAGQGGPSGGRKEKRGEEDRDLNAGSPGVFSVPRVRSITKKLTLPKVGGRVVNNLDHLLVYSPDQVNLSNTRATQAQFEKWYEGVKTEYGVTDEEMSIILNGLMVWCIENGTSPNLSGMWVMMDGEDQVEYPIKPLLEHAQPTFRQIMAHFSNVAEAYIEKRNTEGRYMPRYGLQRNLTDMSLSRYAFDFYEINSKTPERAREAHIQMKAAALRGASSRMFGLDGKVGVAEENTERHTAEDVNQNLHNLLGMRHI